MLIRDLLDEETGKIAELHRKMKMRYDFPDLLMPTFAIKKLVFDQKGELLAGGALKLIGEAFLWIDPACNQYKKAKAISVLADSCSEGSKNIGIEEVSAFIPPELELSFADTLGKLGWRRSPWPAWSIRT